MTECTKRRPTWGTADQIGRTTLLTLCICLSTVTSNAHAQTTLLYDQAREQLVEQAIVGAGVENKRVIKAMRDTPRHEFVPEKLRQYAYEDMALPIGDSQTISSPFIVALMTEAINPQPNDRVLEIGTGSGYQAAVLSQLVADVYTIEIVESLGRTAATALEKLQYDNVHTLIGDGFQGWPEQAPFDKIIVTCSPEDVPQPLVDQLAEGGMMVIPIGQRYQQILCVLRKQQGKLHRESLRPTLFVPMTGKAEQQRDQKPDPLNPSVANGGFEEPPLETGFVPAWYYQRQATLATDSDAPEGEHYLRLANTQRGKHSLAMQGFPVDGRQVWRLQISTWVRYEKVRPGRDNNELPAVVVTFYDTSRTPLGQRLLGPFRGTAKWHRQMASFRVPPDTREAIVQLGMFGSIGEIGFDDVQLRRLDR